MDGISKKRGLDPEPWRHRECVFTIAALVWAPVASLLSLGLTRHIPALGPRGWSLLLPGSSSPRTSPESTTPSPSHLGSIITSHRAHCDQPIYSCRPTPPKHTPHTHAHTGSPSPSPPPSLTALFFSLSVIYHLLAQSISNLSCIRIICRAC